MAAASGWGEDGPARGGEWTTVTRSGRSSHSGPAGRYPSATAPAAPRSPAQAAPAVGGVAKGVAGLEIEDGSRKLDKYVIPVEVSVDGAPPPADGFEEAGLVEAVLRNAARCGYDNPTPVQRYSMPIVLSGRDLMACAQTGSGKTATFCLPVVSGILAAEAAGRGGGGGRGHYDDYGRTGRPRALVLAPTRELAAQIHEETKKFSHQTGIKVKVAYGGTPMIQQMRDIERGVDILVATPGRLVDMIERSKVSLAAIKYLVMDEADRMLYMGFEPQIRKIVDGMGMPRKSVRQTMLLSATFPPQIQRLASDFLSKYTFITVGRVGSSTDLITQKVEFVTYDEKKPYLLDQLHDQSFNSSDGKRQQPLTLVFVETKRDADSLRYWLYSKGFPATAIHGDRTEEERESVLRSFKSGLTPIMVATDVLACGLDALNVSHVINCDLPKSIENYVHRIGRTGRAGNAGRATAFFTEQNHHIAKGLLELTEAKQNVPGWLEDYTGRPCYGVLTYGGRGRKSNGSEGSSSFGNMRAEEMQVEEEAEMQNGNTQKTQIFVKPSEYSSISVQENLSKTRVRRLMEVAVNRRGIKFTDFYLKLSGKVLDLEKMLSDYNIQKDSTIYLLPRMRGGVVSQEFLMQSWNEVLDVSPRFEIVRLPNLLVNTLHNITEVPFLSAHIQHHASQACYALARRHFTGFCFGGQFTAEHILFENGQAWFSNDLEPLEYTDLLARLDYLTLYNIFGNAFWGGVNIRYPMHVVQLLSFLRYTPANARPNQKGVIAYLTNHMAFLPYTHRSTASQLLYSCIRRLNHQDRMSLPMISNGRQRGHWSNMINNVPEMHTVYMFGAAVDNFGNRVPSYGFQVSECVRHSNNYLKHGARTFSLKELEAALSLALNDHESFLPTLLQELAIRIDNVQANSAGVQQFLDCVLDLLGRRTTVGLPNGA